MTITLHPLNDTARLLLANELELSVQRTYESADVLKADLDKLAAQIGRSARLVAAAPALLGAADRAYLALLREPPALRLAYQRELALLRDAIAMATGVSEEETQNRTEQLAAKLGPLENR